MRARYRNSFYSPGKHDPEWYETDAQPVEYRGIQIYHRIKSSNISGNCWDVVRDGHCIGQYCGLSGAKGFVNRLLDGPPVDDAHPVIPSDEASPASPAESSEPEQ